MLSFVSAAKVRHIIQNSKLINSKLKGKTEKVVQNVIPAAILLDRRVNPVPLNVVAAEVDAVHRQWTVSGNTAPQVFLFRCRRMRR